MFYFYIKNNEKIGPVTKEIMVGAKSVNGGVVLNIDRDTLVWREGFSDWTKAEDLDELKPYFRLVAPSLPKEVRQKQYHSTIASSLFYSILVGAIGWLFSFMICDVVFQPRRFDYPKFRTWKPEVQNSYFVETPYWLVDGFSEYTDGKAFWNPSNPSRSYDLRKEYLNRKSNKIAFGAAFTIAAIMFIYFSTINYSNVKKSA